MMSIEIENPTTLLEKADALTNLIEQMYLAHRTHNEPMFEKAHKKAGEIGFDLVVELSEDDLEREKP
jgi:hypothetical protein